MKKNGNENAEVALQICKSTSSMQANKLEATKDGTDGDATTLFLADL